MLMQRAMDENAAATGDNQMGEVKLPSFGNVLISSGKLSGINVLHTAGGYSPMLKKTHVYKAQQ